MCDAVQGVDLTGIIRSSVASITAECVPEACFVQIVNHNFSSCARNFAFSTSLFIGCISTTRTAVYIFIPLGCMCLLSLPQN